MLSTPHVASKTAEALRRSARMGQESSCFLLLFDCGCRCLVRERISAREMEVLLLVGNGASSKEIAGRLGISLRTVEVHRSNLMKKLDAVNTAILTRWAIIAEQMPDVPLLPPRAK